MISIRPAYDPPIFAAPRSTVRVGASDCQAEGISVTDDGEVYMATPECPGYPDARPNGTITSFGYKFVAGLTAIGGVGGYYYLQHPIVGAISGLALGIAAVFGGGYDYHLRTKVCCVRRDGQYQWVEMQPQWMG